MDAAIPMDAKSAPTGIWKTAPSAVFHSAHTHHLFVYEEERRRSDSSIVNLSTESGQVQIDLFVGKRRIRRVPGVGAAMAKWRLRVRARGDGAGQSEAEDGANLRNQHNFATIGKRPQTLSP